MNNKATLAGSGTVMLMGPVGVAPEVDLLDRVRGSFCQEQLSHSSNFRMGNRRPAARCLGIRRKDRKFRRVTHEATPRGYGASDEFERLEGRASLVLVQ